MGYADFEYSIVANYLIQLLILKNLDIEKMENELRKFAY